MFVDISHPVFGSSNDDFLNFISASAEEILLKLTIARSRQSRMGKSLKKAGLV
jgi:hypothetical protein